VTTASRDLGGYSDPTGVFITGADPIDGIRMGCAAFALVHHPQNFLEFAGAAKDKTKDRSKI
jgi:hypothetical protein